MLLNATEQGLKALQAAWTATPANVRKVLGDKFKDQLKASAVAYDEARVASPVPDSISAINQQGETGKGDVF